MRVLRTLRAGAFLKLRRRQSFAASAADVAERHRRKRAALVRQEAQHHLAR